MDFGSDTPTGCISPYMNMLWLVLRPKVANYPSGSTMGRSHEVLASCFRNTGAGRRLVSLVTASSPLCSFKCCNVPLSCVEFSLPNRYPVFGFPLLYCIRFPSGFLWSALRCFGVLLWLGLLCPSASMLTAHVVRICCSALL